MGSHLSSLYGGGAGNLLTESSTVLTFHSSASWHSHFNNIKDSPQLVVIDFSASWCGPCKFMEPVIKEMAGRFTNVQFIKIDVDELSDVAREFQVEAMPTFVLLKKGKEVDRVIGANKDELKKKIKKHQTPYKHVENGELWKSKGLIRFPKPRHPS